MGLETGFENENGKDEKTYTAKELNEVVDKLLEKKLKSQPAVAEVNSGFSADQLATIVTTVAKAMKKDELVDYNAGITEEQIPVDDYNEQGILFCHPSTGWVITDDIRKGQKVLIPYKKKFIFFKYLHDLRHGTGRFESLTALATYMSHSNKEIQWLREHSLYNIAFFENTNIASSQDIEKIQRLSDIMRTIGTFDLPTLYRYCTENGIEKSDNIPSMRQQVAKKIAEKEINEQSNKTQERLSEAMKNKMLLRSDVGKD